MILLLFLLTFTIADTQLACFASINSRLDNTNTFQSAELCRSTCTTPYIGFKNGNECYCLSTWPSSDTSTDCDVPCTGYGQDFCGGASAFSIYVGDGLGAIKNPQDAQRLENNQDERKKTSTLSSRTTRTTTSSRSTAALVAPLSPSSAEDSENPANPSVSPSTLIMTVTKSDLGSTATLISVSSISPSSSSPSPSPSSTPQGKSNTGAIAGGVVGGIAALALIAFLFFFFKRRNSDDDNEKFDYPERSPTIRSNALDMPIHNPFDHPNDMLANLSDRLTDPRMNPVMMGRKRLSEGSLDERDYGRKILHVANPN